MKEFRPCLWIAVCACALLGSVTAPAATVTWTGANGPLWIDNGNWSGGAATNSHIVFYAPGAGNLDTGLGGNITVSSLTFNADALSPVFVRVTNATSRLTLVAGATVNVVAGNHAILGVPGANGSGTNELNLRSSTWNIAAGCTLTNSTRMVQGATGQTITKSGDGLLLLGGNSGGGGAMQINWAVTAGILRLLTGANVGHSGNALTVSSGAALELDNAGYGSINTGGAGNGILTLNGPGIGGTGALRALPGSSSIGDGTSYINLGSAAAIGVDAGGLLTIGQDIRGSAALTKVGAGTLVLNHAANTYSGGTVVSNGTLQVNGALTGSGGVTVASGARLQGTGSIAGLITVADGGTLAPGNSAGTLTVSNSVALGAAATFQADLWGYSQGSQYDRLLMAGAPSSLALGGAALVADLNGFNPTNGASFTVISGFSGSPGAFGSISLQNATDFSNEGKSLSVTYNDGSDVTLTVIPEPGTLATCFLFGAALLCRHRARR